MFKSRYQSCQVQILGKFSVEEALGYLNCMFLLFVRTGSGIKPWSCPSLEIWALTRALIFLNRFQVLLDDKYNFFKRIKAMPYSGISIMFRRNQKESFTMVVVVVLVHPTQLYIVQLRLQLSLTNWFQVGSRVLPPKSYKCKVSSLGMGKARQSQQRGLVMEVIIGRG